MAETNLVTFSYKEVVEALLKKQDIHEGLWALYIEFGIGAANAGPSNDQLSPSAIVPVGKIGIQRATEITNLSVNAAEVNPLREAAIKKEAAR